MPDRKDAESRIAETAELRQKLHTYMASHKEAMIEDLKDLVKIPSVRGEASPGTP